MVKPNNSAYSLIEILAVIVIIAILAGLAMPYYVKTTEKAHQAEAYKILGEIRNAVMRYYYQFNEPSVKSLNYLTWADLDIEVPISKYFEYIIGSPTEEIVKEPVAYAKRVIQIPWLGGQYIICISKKGDIGMGVPK